MTFTISSFMRTASITAWDIFNNGTLELRTGAPPGPNAAATGTVVATITLPADAFDAPGTGGAGVIQKAGTWQDTSADAAGTVGHFRLIQSGDTNGATGAADERLEGTVTNTGGGGDMTMDNSVVEAGQQITVNTFTITQPAS